MESDLRSLFFVLWLLAKAKALALSLSLRLGFKPSPWL